jgi:peptidoglycan hydrolase-like protein with peptidoglycan-binding domain
MAIRWYPGHMVTARKEAGVTMRSGVPFAPAPEGLLKPGAIETIQVRLASQGLLPAAHRDGLLDAATREALRRFQEKKDLPATGLPSYRTIEALRLAPDKAFFSAKSPPGAADRKSSDKGSETARTTP